MATQRRKKRKTAFVPRAVLAAALAGATMTAIPMCVTACGGTSQTQHGVADTGSDVAHTGFGVANQGYGVAAQCFEGGASHSCGPFGVANVGFDAGDADAGDAGHTGDANPDGPDGDAAFGVADAGFG